MAPTKQKFNAYSPELKKEILDKHKEGRKTISLSKEYGIPLGTVTTWIYRQNHGKDILVDHRTTNSGNKKKEGISMEEAKKLVEKYKTTPWWKSLKK